MPASHKGNKIHNYKTDLPYNRPQEKPKQRTPHVDDQFKPNKPGHQYTNNYMQSSVCDQYLRQMLNNITPEVIDYDIAVAYFLEETDHLLIGCIPHSVDKILTDFDVLPPVTGRQNDLRACALHIQSTIALSCLNPGPIQPFALRYPTLKALKKLTSERSKSLRSISTDKAVVLVDLAGRMLAMCLPPKPANPSTANLDVADKSNRDDMSSEDRGLMAFEGAAQVHALPKVHNPLVDILNSQAEDKLNNLSGDFIQPRLSRAKNKPAPHLGAVYGSLPYEAFGYSLGSAFARADTKMQLGLERQGYTLDDVGEGPKSDQHLPQVMGLGEGCVFQRIENARIQAELLWPYEVLRALNAAVNPDTYTASQRVIRFIERNSSAMLSERIKGLHNNIIQGQQINYNLQVGCHRDGKNSNLLDSVFFYGRNYKGGRLCFGSLGVSLCADPGYSIHARFKLLDHGVSPILQGPDINSPPLRISLALYAHADTYSGPARVSAARRNRAEFSDASMWLPFPPNNFSITTCRKILRKEEETWKKKGRAGRLGNRRVN
ncbi:uncharacterized protein MELLADRAFT_65669 [Melampsora larici-populina 98AG31]|uniref:Uncharacterized protein n=1 Tax=Melampsora larici-populina (strain 98AG31 / pathotype 3-4-7) TaxID=747676 RepID=F4RWA2_MELLP|nr:uncharacterized protein MELLADRAFT_65669 [Melampsora larici-populina 98AG31]EGG03249.1 hypothetical protein MELLADRAFT_65669 [Melampsora larici-populina 98AG31]